MNHDHLADFPDGFLWGASTSAYQFEGDGMQTAKGPRSSTFDRLTRLRQISVPPRTTTTGSGTTLR